MTIIGIDVGGTNIKSGLVNRNLIIRRYLIPTLTNSGLDATLNQIFNAVYKLGGDFSAIGIGIAGIIDSKNGIVRFSPNLKGWHNVKLAEILKKEFKKPVRILNDVNAILFGEWLFGAGRGYKNVFLFTLGTGVGGAMVCEGKMVFGYNGFAGEFGHMTIKFDGAKCLCGNYGCLERYVGARAIIKLAQRKMAKYDSSLKKLPQLTPEIIAQEAKRGDKVARDVFSEIGEIIGIGISNIINFLDPEVVIVSGGIARAGRILFEPIILGEKYRSFKILPGQLGDDAGILGAAHFAHHSFSLNWKVENQIIR